jgi:hypothetical protein
MPLKVTFELQRSTMMNIFQKKFTERNKRQERNNKTKKKKTNQNKPKPKWKMENKMKNGKWIARNGIVPPVPLDLDLDSYNK